VNIKQTRAKQRERERESYRKNNSNFHLQKKIIKGEIKKIFRFSIYFQCLVSEQSVIAFASKIFLRSAKSSKKLINIFLFII